MTMMKALPAWLAVAAIAVSPVAVSHADDDNSSSTDSVGVSAGKTPKREGRGAKQRTTAATGPAVSADATANATGSNPLFQNPIIWIGKPNPNPPTPVTEFQTLPLEDVPEPLRGAFGWMNDFEFEACILGLSSTTRGQNIVGPYGTATTGFSSSGC